jgi:hypothetical protein
MPWRWSLSDLAQHRCRASKISTAVAAEGHVDADQLASGLLDDQLPLLDALPPGGQARDSL